MAACQDPCTSPALTEILSRRQHLDQSPVGVIGGTHHPVVAGGDTPSSSEGCCYQIYINLTVLSITLVSS